MTARAGRWDSFMAEYADTRGAARRQTEKRPCSRCGLSTTALGGVCSCRHQIVEGTDELGIQLMVRVRRVSQASPGDELASLHETLEVRS